MDTSEAAIHGDPSRYTVRWVYPKPDSLGDGSPPFNEVINTKEINCEGAGYRDLIYTYLMNGVVVKVAPSPPDEMWRRDVYGFADDGTRVRAWVCNRRR